MAQPFAGIRVLDFSQVLAGPFATQQLAQLGAEVIKIEQPGVGDMTRGADRDRIGTASFLTCNLGKKSVTLDLTREAAAEILPPLIRGSDVLVQNFRPGVMARLGLDYPKVAALRPDIVYCSISGFGQSGPSSHLPAFDGAIQAASGMMSITGHPETGPTRTGYMPVDMATALNAAFAISAALYRRLTSGEGQHLDVAMMDTAMVLQAPQISAYQVAGTVPDLIGNRSPTRAPTANVFQAADGVVQVNALKEPQVKALFEVLEIGERYAELADARERIARTDDINALIGPLFAARPVAYWVEALQDAGVPVAAVREYREVVRDPQFEQRPVFAATDAGAGERRPVVAASHTALNDPPRTRSDAPRLGEHTDTVLQELGFPSERIAQWRAAGEI